ncbi:peptidoglycan-associated lipoprotein Pal [Algiphilus aromaticivorans]|uniref:peptidoglycan-associated lipoprotein Pal n=1 Tax=Algiphilus aromaticivorans TaxID=382454 RepID=UPI0006940D3D
MKIRYLMLSACAALLLSACASTGERSTSDASSADTSQTSERDTSGMGDERRGSAEPLPMSEEEKMAQKKAELERENTVYFEFDSSDLSREGRSTVEKHADFLTRNPDVRVRLEGHTDERGTREYNIGLGERRAQAVARVLTARGVSSDQFSVVSYGEERPAVSGSNEEAWAKNRRVEIVYR